MLLKLGTFTTWKPLLRTSFSLSAAPMAKKYVRENVPLSRFGVLVAQLESIVNSSNQKPPEALLCFDLLSDLISAIDEEPKVFLASLSDLPFMTVFWKLCGFSSSFVAVFDFGACFIDLFLVEFINPAWWNSSCFSLKLAISEIWWQEAVLFDGWV